MSSYRFILSGGGTGGHIFPAIAIADGLKARFPEAGFLFVGAKGRMEMEKVPQAGYPIKGLWISGLSRTISLSLFLFPIKLAFSLLRSFLLLIRYRPHLVIGTGGYASAPLLKMAQLMGFPTLIQEQNSYAGVTNKWLAKKANSICVAYPEMEKYFPASKVIYTGNPVRAHISGVLPTRLEALSHFGLSESRPVLLVLGGSLGAKKVNEFIASQLDYFKEKEVQLLWQCGPMYYEAYKALQTEQVKVLDFISQMPMGYAAADLVISRAGAGAVSESMIVGCPTIFIPSPNVAEDHQTKNAMAVAKMGAGGMIKETDLEANFIEVFERLLWDPVPREEMVQAMKKAAKPQATHEIVVAVESLLTRQTQSA